MEEMEFGADARSSEAPAQDIRFERIEGTREDAHRTVTTMVGLDDPKAPTLEIAPGIKIPHPGLAGTGEW
jgi:hypothetical protein